MPRARRHSPLICPRQFERKRRRRAMAGGYDPDPKLKFTFGLWTVGNPGRDPFGLPTREVIGPVDIVNMLGDVGAYGVNFHDNDLVPIDATPTERDRIVRDFKKALKQN